MIPKIWCWLFGHVRNYTSNQNYHYDEKEIIAKHHNRLCTRKDCAEAFSCSLVSEILHLIKQREEGIVEDIKELTHRYTEREILDMTMKYKILALQHNAKLDALIKVIKEENDK